MARLDFTATNILTASELDELSRQAISNVTNAGKPTGTAEGETIAVTDKDRHEWWNGSAWIRGTNWAAAGRTFVDRTGTTAGVGATTTAEMPFASVNSDADSFYTGFDGSHYLFTVPTGLGGVYAITVFSDADAGMSAGGTLILASSIFVAVGYVPAGNDRGSVTTIVPLAAGDTFYVQQYNGGSGSRDYGQHIYVVRLCL